MKQCAYLGLKKRSTNHLKTYVIRFQQPVLSAFGQPKPNPVPKGWGEVQCRSRDKKRLKRSNLEIPTGLKNVQLKDQFISSTGNITLEKLRENQANRKMEIKNGETKLTPGNVFLLWQALTTLSASSLEGHIRKQHPTIPVQI